jgi:ABC-2 type transport system permease protein
MMFLIMVRVSDPLLPRAIFGLLNTLLYFPSGAIYPVQSLPAWLRAITVIDPFTYSVHGLRVLLLKGATPRVMLPDVLFLTIFAVVMFTLSVRLFQRTL